MLETIKLKKAEKEIEPLVEEEFNKWKIENGFVDKDGKPSKRVMGSCYIKWSIKKRLMKEKYDIDWKTPAEEHPDITFD